MAGDRRLSRPDSALPDWHIPDAAYRPIPIAWFAGAFLLQLVVLYAGFLLLASAHPFWTIAGSVLATLVIGLWTWNRGMSSAAKGWRIATAAMLLVQLGFVMLAAIARL